MKLPFKVDVVDKTYPNGAIREKLETSVLVLTLIRYERGFTCTYLT